MLIPTPLQQRIKEFQQVIGVPKYNGVIESLITEVFFLPINSISVDYNSPLGSRLENRGKEGMRIFIRATGEPSHDQLLLFAIMHELGHFHDSETLPKGKENDPVLRRGREMRAWAWADQAFEKYPELAADRTFYDDYKAECLATYPIH